MSEYKKQVSSLPWRERWAIRLLIWHARRTVPYYGEVELSVTFTYIDPTKGTP